MNGVLVLVGLGVTVVSTALLKWWNDRGHGDLGFVSDQWLADQRFADTHQTRG
jgi:hypothetical protein